MLNAVPVLVRVPELVPVREPELVPVREQELVPELLRGRVLPERVLPHVFRMLFFSHRWRWSRVYGKRLFRRLYLRFLLL